MEGSYEWKQEWCNEAVTQFLGLSDSEALEKAYFMYGRFYVVDFTDKEVEFACLNADHGTARLNRIKKQ